MVEKTGPWHTDAIVQSSGFLGKKAVYAETRVFSREIDPWWGYSANNCKDNAQSCGLP